MVVVVQTREDLADAMELELLAVGGERLIGNMPAEAYWSPWSLQNLQTCFENDCNEASFEDVVGMYIG